MDALTPPEAQVIAERLVKDSREAIDILPNMDPPIAAGVMREFLLSHQKRPGGLSIEIGTFEGATSRMMLKALDILYSADVAGKAPSAPPPFVVTCDPYGGKPYLGGHLAKGPDGAPACVVHDGRALGYDDKAYGRMKKALAGWSNHAHYPVRSYELLEHIHAFWPWPQQERFVTFVLLDGEHNAETIYNEAAACLSLDALACVVVDNADTDPRTIPTLEAAFRVSTVAESHRKAEDGSGTTWSDILVRVKPKESK